MTNDENVKNINETNEDVNQETSADAADAEETESTDMPNLDPHESADVLKLNNWLEELADKSSVKSQVFCYKTILFIGKLVVHHFKVCTNYRFT